MIVVTGGAGFIGSNLVHALNRRGREDILVVDDLSAGQKFRNLVDCEIADYQDKDEFMDSLRRSQGAALAADAVFHLGACADTTEWDGRYMMATNYGYSKELLHFCMNKAVRFIYASSAAVYGCGREFRAERDCEAPANIYAYSKLLFDQYVRSIMLRAPMQIVGLRYFNVYGPREQHKGDMASVVYHFNDQLINDGKVRLFVGTGGYADGEQRRDFIFVDDAVDVTCWIAEQAQASGIFNVGTGHSQTFNEVAKAVIAWHGKGEIEYIPFPEHLHNSYQSYTQADIAALRACGFDRSFRNVQTGVPSYLDWLAKHV